jgi:hypothetical protein
MELLAGPGPKLVQLDPRTGGIVAIASTAGQPLAAGGVRKVLSSPGPKTIQLDVRTGEVVSIRSGVDQELLRPRLADNSPRPSASSVQQDALGSRLTSSGRISERPTRSALRSQVCTATLAQ